MSVLKAVFQEVLLDGSCQPCRGAGTGYDDGLESATSGSRNLPPVVELVVEDVYRLTDMKAAQVNWGVLLLDEALQLRHLESVVNIGNRLLLCITKHLE